MHTCMYDLFHIMQENTSWKGSVYLKYLEVHQSTAEYWKIYSGTQGKCYVHNFSPDILYHSF